MEPQESASKRYTIDCRSFPGSKCSLTISGTEEEVLKEGEFHAVSVHGEKKEPGLRDKVRQFMKEDKTYNA